MNHLLSVVPPSSYSEAELQKLVHANMRKELVRSDGTPSERGASKSLVWMPYYRVQFEYRRSEKELVQKLGETARSETAINAMFCGCAQSQDDFFMLFRPNYLKYSMIAHSPRLGEVIGHTFRMDLDAFLTSLLKRLNEAKKELRELKTTSNRSYAHIRRYSRILPMAGELKEAEKAYGKTAKLDALTNILRLCLNLFEEAESIKAISNSTFYYPTAVVASEPRGPETVQFLIVNLVKSGSIRRCLNLDNALTQLCNSNDACKEVLSRTIAQATFDT